MSRFSSEFRVVPATARIIAAIIYLLAAIGIGAAAWGGIYDANNPWIWASGLVFLLVPLPLVAWVLLVGYVNADARRRGMRHTAWTLIAIFAPSGIGIILYFLMREPMLRPCPSCSARNKAGLSYCPHCGYALARICSGCNKPVEEGWKNCAHCGVAL